MGSPGFVYTHARNNRGKGTQSPAGFKVLINKMVGPVGCYFLLNLGFHAIITS